VPDHQTDRFLERITVEGSAMLSIADWEAGPGRSVEAV
jgi:hypothetical protein